MPPLHIIEPFWSGWKFYGWDKPVPGIGIDKRLVLNQLVKSEHIELTIGKDKTVYHISPVTVLSLVKKYHSERSVRYGNTVCVIPQNKLLKENEIPIPDEPKMVQPYML